MRVVSGFLIAPLMGMMVLSCSNSVQLPNIVVIVADDLGYRDLSSYGSTDINTPHIDDLALSGVRFTNFYSNGAECSPTRTALLTGRYQQRAGGLECAIGAGNVGRYDEAQWLSEKNELGLPVDMSTLMKNVKAAGYSTAMFGKWHLGYERKFRPDKHGFDHSFGLLGGLGDYFYHLEQVKHNLEDFSGGHTLMENGVEVFHDGNYLTELISSKAIQWLDQVDQERPFFLYLPYTAPHLPYQGPGDDLGYPLSSEDDIGSRAKYAEMVESLDDEIGRIVEFLENSDPDEETLIIFFSDNGGTTFADNGGFRGGKGTVYEGGIHVPCIIKWKGRIEENQVSEQSCISFDLTRSILEIIGGNYQDESDGYNIIGHVIDGAATFDRTLYWRARRGERIEKAVRHGDYKYLHRINGNVMLDEGLYNLKVDPGETQNLLLDSLILCKKLKLKISDWESEVQAPRLRSWYLGEN